MYKIMVVDDEKLLRQGFIHITNWMNQNCIITGEASNGKEALELIEANCPDILITDIVMPVMNGLDLIHTIKKNYSHIQVIVLSSYSEFQYVREAMKLGAVDYILKQEIELDSLLKAISKAKLEADKFRISAAAELSYDNREFQENLLLSLLTSDSIDKDSFFQYTSEYGIPLVDQYLQLILLCPRNPSIRPEQLKRKDSLIPLKDTLLSYFDKGLNPTIFFSSEKIITILINNNDSESFLLEASCMRAVEKIRNSGNPDYISVLSGKYDGIEQTRNIYFQTLKASQFSFYDKGLLIIKSSDYEGKIVIPHIDYKHTVSLLEKLDFQNLYESNARFIRETLEKRMYFETYELKKMLIEIFDFMIFKIDELGFNLEEIKNNRFEFIKKIENAETLLELIQEFKNSIDATSRTSNKKQIKYNELVTGVINYIHNYFQDDISLSSTASHLHVNKNYLCDLFKQQTGENFSDFLVKVRLEKAKEILKLGNTSVSSVGEKVGYPNSSYFIQLFKKNTGMTPLEFSRRFSK
jgi:two-component system, response regulator YesN